MADEDGLEAAPRARAEARAESRPKAARPAGRNPRSGPAPAAVRVDPRLLGFALVVSLSTSLSLFVGSRPDPAVALPGSSPASGLVRIAVFVGAALLSGRIGGLARHGRPLWAAAGGMAAGAGLVALAALGALGQAGPAVGAAYLAGTALNAAGYALLYLYWVELYARMDLPHVLVAFTLVHLCSAALSYAVALVPARWPAVAFLLAMPLLSAALYRAALRRSEGAPYMQGEPTVTGWSFPARPIALLFTFTFANSFIRHFLTADLKGAVLLGVVVAAAAVLAAAWRYRGFDLRALYAVCLPVVVAACLCVLVGLPGFGVAGGLLANGAYAVFSIFTTVLLCSISFRYGVDALWLFGFAQAAVSLGSTLSGALVSRVDFVAADPALLTLTVGCVIMVFVTLYAAFSGPRAFDDSWGVTRAADEGAADTGDEALLAERCARLARRCGLTRREEEVLALLAQDMSFAEVEERLVISNSTLKTHARHVYAKLGVSGKKELAELVRGEG